MHCETDSRTGSARRPGEAGFSLIEMAMVVVVMGIIFALSVPAYTNFRKTSALKSAKENIVAEIKLAREKAIATRAQQEIRFFKGFANSDYHIWNGSVADPKWNLPTGITYVWSTGTFPRYRMQPNGRCLDSGIIILENERGDRDTISVLTSGMVTGK